MDIFNSKEMKTLAKAFLTLKNEEEVFDFFEDLFTISELMAMEQRFTVALALDRKTPYHNIAETTGASTTTISRVNRCLKYGKEGYKKVIDRLNESGKLGDE